jgi:S-adenosylmethionine decarboxylase
MTGSMGVHILVNLFGCPTNVLEHKDVVAKLLNEVVSEAKLTKVNETHFQFKPVGVTSVILLAESHISIHTWPESGSAAVDIFCCSGKESAETAFKSLVAKFHPTKFDKKFIQR